MKLEKIDNLDYLLKINNDYYKNKLGYQSGLMDNEEVLQNFQKFGYLQGLYLKNKKNENIGYIVYQITGINQHHNKKELSLYLSDIYIDEKYQNKGLGNELINSTIIIDYMKNLFDFENIQIYSTIAIDNINSLKLHLKNNFKVYDIEKNEYKINNKKIDGYLLYKNYQGINNFDLINKLDSTNNDLLESLNINQNSNSNSILEIDNYSIDLFSTNNFIERFKYIDKFIYKSENNLKFQFLEESVNESEEEFKENFKDFYDYLQEYTEKISKKFENLCKVEFDNGLAKIIINKENSFHVHPFKNMNSIMKKYRENIKKIEESQDLKNDLDKEF